MRGLRRATRLTVVACALAGVLRAPAGVASPAQTASAWRPRGGLWLAVTLDVPQGGSYSTRITWRIRGSTATACIGDAAGSLYGGAWVSTGRGTMVAVQATSPEGGTFEAGDAAPPQMALRMLCGFFWRNGGRRAIDEELFFIAGNGDVRDAAISVAASGGARVVAESSGSSTYMWRERDFETAVAAYAQRWPAPSTGCSAAAYRGGMTHTFKRHATAAFASGETENALPVTAPNGEMPALMSIEGPHQATGLYARKTSYGLSLINLDAPAGTYRFTIEAMAAPLCSAVNIFAGKRPIAFLAAADADYPACTTASARVISRSVDGHPRCL